VVDDFDFGQDDRMLGAALLLSRYGPKNENAGNLAVSGVSRVPHSSSDQTPSSVLDDESSVTEVLFRLPAKLSV